jgi:hypothetical protein
MGHTEQLITVASWEQRFILGITDLIIKSRPHNILMYHFEEYDQYSNQNRNIAVQLCKDNDINLETYGISFRDPAKTWNTIFDTLNVNRLAGKEIIIDFTTMPRETLWTLLNLLEGTSSIIDYIYHTPEKYNEDWLSRDPGKPRLVYKLAGEAKLGARTLLLILPGYDPERVEQLVRFFDPYHTLLGLQTGEQFQNQFMNINAYKRYERQPRFTLFDLDAYSGDHGFATIEALLGNYLGEFNIIMSSLGPKPSAIALYRLKKKYPQTSLAYTPSNEFNLEYSYGIGEKCTGRI